MLGPHLLQWVTYMTQLCPRLGVSGRQWPMNDRDTQSIGWVFAVVPIISTYRCMSWNNVLGLFTVCTRVYAGLMLSIGGKLFPWNASHPRKRRVRPVFGACAEKKRQVLYPTFRV